MVDSLALSHLLRWGGFMYLLLTCNHQASIHHCKFSSSSSYVVISLASHSSSQHKSCCRLSKLNQLILYLRNLRRTSFASYASHKSPQLMQQSSSASQLFPHFLNYSRCIQGCILQLLHTIIILVIVPNDTLIMLPNQALSL